MPNDPELLFHFIIPHTPVAKGRARSTIKRGRGGAPILTKQGQPIIGTYTPEKTRDFEALVRDFAQRAAPGEPLSCPVDLLVQFQFKIPSSFTKWQRQMAADGLLHHTKKPDCSNLVKAIEDACNGVLFKDDGQVVGCITDKAYTTGREQIVVHGYRRAGVSATALRAEAVAFLSSYKNPSIRMNHLPLGHRMRTLRLVPA